MDSTPWNGQSQNTPGDSFVLSADPGNCRPDLVLIRGPSILPPMSPIAPVQEQSQVNMLVGSATFDLNFFATNFFHKGYRSYQLLSTHRGIHADVIVYIFTHLHTTLRTEGNMLDKN